MKLILTPSPARPGIPALALTLRGASPSKERPGPLDELFSVRDARLYADVPYAAALLLEGEQPPDAACVHLNEARIEIPLCEDAEQAALLSPAVPGELRFENRYGFVRLELECGRGDASETYFSEYAAVMRKPDARGVSEAMRGMEEYVYRRHNAFLGERDALPSPNAEPESEERGFGAFIALMEGVERVYAHNLPFFRSSPRMRTEATYRVDDFHRLQRFEPATLQYIARHPSELLPAGAGIRCGGRSYLPAHTLIGERQRRFEGEENRAVLGFIHSVARQTGELHAQAEALCARLEAFPAARSGEDGSGYVNSAAAVLQATLRNLRAQAERLAPVRERLTRLYWTYRELLPVEDVPQTGLPRPTAVFLNVAAYRQIYDAMIRWYRQGAYSLSDEEFLLSLLLDDQIYEYYALFKLADAIQVAGYRFQPERSARHAYALRGALHRDTEHINTFAFAKPGGGELTLYFQPVIFGQGYAPEQAVNNGIALRRATSLSLEYRAGASPAVRSVRDAYYNPDFLLKYSDARTERYIIADAKFSTVESVRSHQLARLAYKYAFSVRPASARARLAGVLILCGKDMERRFRLSSAFDLEESPHAEPNFWLASLTQIPGQIEAGQLRALGGILDELIPKTE